MQIWRYGGGGRGGCEGGCVGGLTLFGGGVRGGSCIGVVVAKGVEKSMGGGGASNRESSQRVVKEVLMRLAKGLVKGILTGSTELSESSGKTSRTVFHFFSILNLRLWFWLSWRE